MPRLGSQCLAILEGSLTQRQQNRALNTVMTVDNKSTPKLAYTLPRPSAENLW